MIIPDECGDYELVEQTTLQVKGNFTSFIIIFIDFDYFSLFW